MNRDVLRQSIVALSVVAVVVVNGLANVLPLNGQTTGEISDRFAVYFVPAGYVFSIWGLIYAGLVAYGVFQALPSQRENQRMRSIGWLFVFSSAANIAWLFLWHYEIFAFTVIAMVALLLSLIAIYLRLGIGRFRVSSGESWLVRVPFSIYLGWITVATIANITAVLKYYNWDGFGIDPQIWAVIMLAVGTVIASIVSFTRGDIAYSLVIVWAFIGIAVKQADAPLVSTAAWVTTATVLVALVVGTVYHRQRGRPPVPAG
ncbi:MAG: TspO/MBR family protein [Chloroflexota bacterium]